MPGSYPRAALSHYHQHQQQQTRLAVPARQTVKFKESPFYQVKETITPIRELSGISSSNTLLLGPSDTMLSEMPQNRHSLHETVTLSEPTCTALKADTTLRVMLYCASASSLGPYAFNVDIAFPSQIEVKVNGDEVRKSFKGLKNKPGTTKPVDITDLLRKAPGYQNDILVTYALTKEVCHVPVQRLSKSILT
jgi:E3 SUMO-protein ligase PIAS1